MAKVFVINQFEGEKLPSQIATTFDKLGWTYHENPLLNFTRPEIEDLVMNDGITLQDSTKLRVITTECKQVLEGCDKVYVMTTPTGEGTDKIMKYLITTFITRCVSPDLIKSGDITTITSEYFMFDAEPSEELIDIITRAMYYTKFIIPVIEHFGEDGYRKSFNQCPPYVHFNALDQKTIQVIMNTNELEVEPFNLGDDIDQDPNNPVTVRKQNVINVTPNDLHLAEIWLYALAAWKNDCWFNIAIVLFGVDKFNNFDYQFINDLLVLVGDEDHLELVSTTELMSNTSEKLDTATEESLSDDITDEHHFTKTNQNASH